MRASRVIPVLALLVGVLLIMQGLLGIVAPDAFVGVVRFFQTPSVVYIAALLRIAIGIVLLCAVTGSRLPMFLRILGGFVLLGGLLTPFVARQFAEVILDWWSWHGSALVRLFAAVSLALGLVTAYAVAPRPRNA